MQGNKYITLLTYTLLLGVFILIASNKHSHSRKNHGYHNYQGVMWADQAGYYVYLPATFIYHFNANNFPDSIDIKTGEGFYLKNGKLQNKYTYGVALLEMPFFFIAHHIANSLGYPADGFSAPYHWAIDVAACFYLTLGLYFLSLFLKTRFSTKVVRLVIISLLLATNLFYYGLDDNGMSHVYSFFLFSALLYLVNNTSYLAKYTFKQLILIGLTAGLIVVIRPTNIIFLSFILFLDTTSFNEVKVRLKNIIRLKTLLPLVLTSVIMFVPQLMYWHYSSGSFISYSYNEEGFNWLHPITLVTWFSPDNGLFLYTPFFFIIVGAMVYQIQKKHSNGVYLLALFIVISYIFSCWWDWDFGCAFGARSYVEYLTLFSIPVATVYSKILKSNKLKQALFFSLVLLLAVYNLKMIYSFDNCYNGVLDAYWDWGAYINHLTSPTK